LGSKDPLHPGENSSSPVADAGSVGFPITRHSIIRALGNPDPHVRRRAFETIAAIYWKPVYKYIRFRWHSSQEDAEDLTQDFFATAFEKQWLDRYDPKRARFRTFVRMCVDGTVANDRKASTRLKRGGAVALVSMDFAGAEAELALASPPADAEMEQFFRREWVRSIFELAIERLRVESVEHNRETHLALFLRYDVDGPSQSTRPSYSDLANEFGLPETQVTNYLALVRRRFRVHVLEALAELTGNEEEYVVAARDLLGVIV
jgi:RNA polymerase sigma factor (sigma-70 family)